MDYSYAQKCDVTFKCLLWLFLRKKMNIKYYLRDNCANFSVILDHCCDSPPKKTKMEQMAHGVGPWGNLFILAFVCNTFLSFFVEAWCWNYEFIERVIIKTSIMFHIVIMRLCSRLKSKKYIWLCNSCLKGVILKVV